MTPVFLARSPRGRTVGLALIAGATFACNADRLDLDSRECGLAGECVSGYVCDQSRNLCVRPSELGSGGDSAASGSGGAATAGAGGSATGGSGGGPVAGAGGTVAAGAAGSAAAGGSEPTAGTGAAPTAGEGGTATGGTAGSAPGGAAGAGPGGLGGTAAGAGGAAGAAAIGGAAGVAGQAGTGAIGGAAGAGGSGAIGGTAGVAGLGAVGGAAGAAGTGGSGGCAGNLGDCDGNPGNGCETDLNSNVDHCGACSRPCSTGNVMSLRCELGICTSACVLGWANCTEPAAPAADDGCETSAIQANQCGSCDNDCVAQHAGTAVCASTAPYLCECANDNRCRIQGQGSCDLPSGLCICDGSTCNPGEACARPGVPVICSCNGGPACAAGEVCCQTPAGCQNLQTDPNSCGACGHVCPPGFSCAAGECICTDAAQCDAGSPGTCNGAGRCVCGPTTCSAGSRCQPDGMCG